MAKPPDSGVRSLDPTSLIIHFTVSYYQCSLHKTNIPELVNDCKHLSIASSYIQVVILVDKLISLNPFHLKTALSRQFYIAGDNKLCLVLHIKCLIILSDCNQTGSFLKYCTTNLQNQI
jgi:hypothetical protein